jgi:peptidoglycan/xylan/chitin deacetylase (PgdA/CDA1 family)
MEWLRDNGFTCLLPSDLVKIRAGEMQMPDRPVMITFDDGYNSTYGLAFPILKETGMKAAVALVTCVSVESDYAGWGMSWRMIREMQASGLIEFGSHTNFLHNEETAQGLTRLEGESREDYIARISEDLLLSQRLIQEHTGVPCIYLAYPYGKSDPWLVEWLRETGTFSVTTTTTTRMADLADGLIGLTRYRVSMKETPASRLAIRFMVR